jgi:hypothetical protein
MQLENYQLLKNLQKRLFVSQEQLRSGLLVMDIKNHQQTAHAPSTIAKIQAVAIGKKLSDTVQTFGSTYRRLDPDKPSPTV